MTPDTTEKGLETLICTALTGAPCSPNSGEVSERPAEYSAGWICSDPTNYDREYCVDLIQLKTFLTKTQPEITESLALDEDGKWRGPFPRA